MYTIIRKNNKQSYDLGLKISKKMADTYAGIWTAEDMNGFEFVAVEL